MTSSGSATTINDICEDVLKIIVARLPALSFAYAACVNRSWNLVCNRVLCRPKLSSACVVNPSLPVAIEDIMNKLLSEPIRPHFAIAYVDAVFDLQEASQLITSKLSSKVPVITHCPGGIIGDVPINGGYEKIQRPDLHDDNTNHDDSPIMIIIGFLPGIKVKTIPLVKQTGTHKFVADVAEFSTSISGSKSPAAIMMFGSCEVKAVMEVVDHFMASETVVVGDHCSKFRYASGESKCITIPEQSIQAVALVFAKDMNKPLGIGETQFHTVVTSGLLPVGPKYEAYVKASFSSTLLTARKVGSDENLYDGAPFMEVYEGLGNQIYFGKVHIVVRKRRKCFIGQEKVGRTTSLAFHEVIDCTGKDLLVAGTGIETGDQFHFSHADSATARSSAANVCKYLKSFKQEITSGGDKREVFGALLFTSSARDELIVDQPYCDTSMLLHNFPSVPYCGSLCHGIFGRGDLIPRAKESKEQKLVPNCCAHKYSALYLIMSYTP